MKTDTFDPIHAAEIVEDAAMYLTDQHVLPCDESNACAESLSILGMRLRDMARQPAVNVNAQLLKSLCEMLYIAEGSDPHDFDEDTQRIFNEAQAARDAAADPCPDCHAREVLCESCGGLGYVPKETKPLRVLCHVTGGVASLAYDPGIEHVIADADEGGPIDIPAGWEDLAEQLDVDTETDPDDAESERWRCSNCGEEGDGNDFCSTKHRETTMVCPGCGSHDVFLQDDEQDD